MSQDVGNPLGEPGRATEQDPPFPNARHWTWMAVGVLFVANALYTMADPDLWGHLRFGLAHWEEGRLARVDPYSYTATGHAWTNHEWLTEWCFAVFYTWCGTAGLMLLRALLLAATVAAVGVICWRRRLPPAATLMLALAGITIAAQFFRVRPQMFTYALMAWLLVICDGHRPGRRWGLCLVPLLMLAWTNLHAGFVAGLGVFGVYWLSFVAEASRTPQRTREWTFLATILAATWAATLINPYGFDYWRYVIFAVTLPRPAITEWQPVFAHNGVLQAIYVGYVAVTGFCWLFGTRKGHWAETAIFALGVVLAGKHVRHLPFLMLFASVVLARRVPEVLAIWGPQVRKRFESWTAPSPRLAGGENDVRWSAFGFFLLLLMAAVGGGWKLGQNLIDWQRAGGLVVSSQDYPVQAVEFLRQNRIGGNLDCGFNWGEYCIFKLYPQCRVFCDGRYETVYPHAVSQLALAVEGEENWRRRLEDYPTELILAPLDDKFAAWAAERDDVVEIYRDATARVLLRRTPATTAIFEAWQAQRLKTVDRVRPARRFPA